MGLINKIKNTEDQSTKTGPSNNLIELHPRETEWLLQLIKNSSFQGKDVEIVYNTTLKLQQLYLANNK
jgi:hypothetical protein